MTSERADESGAGHGRATYRIYDDPVVLTDDETAAKAAAQLGYPVNELRHKKNTLPSQLGATVTVDIPEFECRYCDDGATVAREDGDWVCLRCGIGVSEKTAADANERLEAGEFERGRIEQEVDDLARSLGLTQGATIDGE